MRYELARHLAVTERARFLVEGLDLEAATGIADAQWEPFQLGLLNDDGLLRLDRKSRQIGYSWAIAADAVAICQLVPRSTCLFLSINREESAEKVRYAKQIYESLYPSFRVPLTSDNLTTQGYSNGSRIISLPQRAARGKAQARIYLDEFAHYRLDRDVYAGSFPVTTKGGVLRIGSTTMGARGMFWEIDQQRIRRYPGFSRCITPWYATTALLKPGLSLREVTRLAPTLSIGEQVERFGNTRIQDIYANLPEDDFAQEYATEYIDEAASFISWADIIACTMDGEGPQSWCALSTTPTGAFDALDQVADQVMRGRIRGALVWGLDIGRKKDLTELVIVEVLPPPGAPAGNYAGPNLHIVRAVLSLARQEFELQEQLCRTLLEQLPVVRGFIDQNGLGMQLAETLHLRRGYGERAMPMTFANHTKSLMATHLKTRFQQRGRGGIAIPNDRSLKYQVHSVRRHITASNNVIFDVEESERHHADKFWALALANEAGETLARVDAYPTADGLALRTTQRLNALVPQPEAPDMGGAWGYGLTADDLALLVEQGLTAFMPRLHEGAIVDAAVVEAAPADAPAEPVGSKAT